MHCRSIAILATATGLSLSALVHAQPQPRFEAASVKPSTYGPGTDGICRGGPGNGDPGIFTCNYVDLKRIIVLAFGLPPFQVAAPDWTQNQRFNIQAAVPSGATREQLSTMLQNLLVERFHLAFHRESREMTKYDLVVTEDGPRLKELQDAPANRPAPPAPVAPYRWRLDKDGYPSRTTQGWSTINGRARFYQPRGRLNGLILMLGMMMDKPVVDATGLKGSYEIEMHWVGEPVMSAQTGAAVPPLETAPDPGPSGPTIEQALREQLGLKLESKKGPVEMLIVDRIDKVPTEN